MVIRTKMMCAISLALTVAPLASVNAAELYNDFYKHFNSASSLEKDGQNPPDDVGSWAYNANNAEAFGGVIGFGTRTRISNFSTIMSNWNGWDPDGGVGTTSSDFTTDLTLEIYNVDRSGSAPSAGGLLGSFAETQMIDGREIPSASNASFAANGTDSVVTWNLNGLNTPDEILFMVQVDGLELPQNSVPIELSSLNIAAVATGTSPDVTAGIDTDPGVYWRSVATNGNISRFEAGQVFARASGTAIPNASTVLLMLTGLISLGVAASRRLHT